VPVPRRFDRQPPERDQTRINERIRVAEVRLVDEDGSQVGVVSRDEALQYARSRDLDLVEVAADARPPVCRVLDYSKYKYEQEQKAKAARKHQKQVHVREIKLRPKIATNDYETKKGHVRRFLDSDNKVKVTIMFRGREMSHPERGEALLMRLAEDVADLGQIEQRPNRPGGMLARPELEDLSQQHKYRADCGRLEVDRHRSLRSAKSRREQIGQSDRHDAVEPRNARAHRDEGEHVQVARLE